MPVRGRRPKPTHLKVLAGNPGKRQLNTEEPKPKVEYPKCPLLLQGEARRQWYALRRVLLPLGYITLADESILVAHCDAWATFVEASQQITKKGLLPSRSRPFFFNIQALAPVAQLI